MFNLGVIWYTSLMKLTLEIEHEDDGRWLAEVPEIAGVMAYGGTYIEAIANAAFLAVHALSEQLKHGEAHHEFRNTNGDAEIGLK